jgi:hypothetical protein
MLESAMAQTRNPWDQPFASNSVWNVGIGSGAKWGSSSDADVAQLRSLKPWVNAGEYGMPIYVGTASDPLVTIVATDQSYGFGPQQVHIPIDALPAAGADKHMVLFDKTNPTKMWSYYDCTFNNGRDVTGGITAFLGGVRGGRVRRDTVALPLSGASAGWCRSMPPSGRHAGRA